ncbi:MAG: SET domain-containing protein-lysine N-methyltransferase [bacterium]|nr:SET domain-containing protein-lysine N-methyltransferase [bacterium]
MFLLSDDSWEIKKTREKGYGVFSKKEIKMGTVIGDYLGKVIRIREYDLENDKKGLYFMYFSDQAGIYPNLNEPGPHLLNHSCQPNCWIYIYRGHSLFFALRKIEAHEELTISYLLSPKDETCAPCTHICRCASTNCTSTMHLSKDKYEYWQKFQNKERKKTKRVRVVFGTNLPKLPSYPKTIPHNPIYKIMSSSVRHSF